MVGTKAVSNAMWWLFRLMLGTVITVGFIKLFQVAVDDVTSLIFVSAAGYGISFILVGIFRRNENKLYTKPITHE